MTKTAINSLVGNLKSGGTQTERTPGRTDEVKNNAGGYVFTVSNKARLERFLILGTDGGTYYVGESDLTKQNYEFVLDLIAADERLVIDTVIDVVDNNRAAKNSPSLFVTALVLSVGTDKAYVRESGLVNKVARTGTHLFELTGYLKALGGLGRAKRRALGEFYTEKDVNALAYQAVKYRSRNGFTHRDMLRLTHVTPDARVANFILGKSEDESGIAIIDGFNRMQRAGSVKEVIAILNEYKNLPWETIPTQFLNDAEVWKTLFYNGALGQTALIRNITRLAKNGALDDVKFAGDVAKALADKDRIVKGRVHPVAYANALGIYRNGQMDRNAYWGYGGRSKDWKTNAKVAGGLEAGFYESFGTIEPANKVTNVALDVSGSMAGPAPAGLVGLNCREASAVMAMVTVRTEPYVVVTGFSHKMVDINISDTDSLETVVQKISNIPFGRTDCALPMLNAKAKGQGIDTFVVYTDNETWSGNVKPAKALRDYRQASGRDARLAVVGMVATEFTIADPTDSGMMDFVGFDSAAPRVLADFSAGRI